MGLADEGDHVVLAMGVHLDVAQHDDVVIARHLVEGAREHVERAFVIAREELVIGVDHALRRIAQALAHGVVAGIGDQRADGLLGLLARRTGDGRPAPDARLRPRRKFLDRGVHSRLSLPHSTQKDRARFSAPVKDYYNERVKSLNIRPMRPEASLPRPDLHI